MGSKETIAATIIGSTGKVLTIDSVVPREGALLLLDAAHSLGGFGTTVPAEGALLNNVVAEQAALTLGVSESATRCTFVHGGGATPTGLAKELTSKGALHGAVSQTTLVTGHTFAINMPAALKSYFLANQDNDYFFSIWLNLTRAPASLTTPPYGAIPSPYFTLTTNGSNGTGNILTVFHGANWSGTPFNSLEREPSMATNGPKLANKGITEHTGTLDGLKDHLTFWGSYSHWGGAVSGNPKQAPSFALYRMYIEDLTISGRSYAEVDALDLAAHTAAFAEGGKFYDDVITPPATLLGE